MAHARGTTQAHAELNEELPETDLLKIHHALLHGSRVASAQFVEACGLRLMRLLRRAYPETPEEMLTDSVYDALLHHLEQPERYSERQGSLLNYLVSIARHKLVDRFRASSRRREKFVGHDVELAQLEANTSQTGRGPRSGFEDEVIEREIQAGVDTLARQILTDARDRAVWDLMRQGRTATEDFVQILELAHLPLEEQRAEVKRHRDRIQKKIRRQKDSFKELLS